MTWIQIRQILRYSGFYIGEDNDISEFGTITMKMISSAINNGREQTKIGSINIRVVPPAPQRFFCQRPMVMSVTVGRLKWQADEVPV